jgi:hypothetical protein
VRVPRRNPGGARPYLELRFGVAQPRRTKLLTIESAAYIAGLIDGEGTVTLTRIHAHECRTLVVSIVSTEIELLRFVHEHAGVGKITRKRAYSSRHAPSFCYYITSRQALALLRQVIPYLRSYKLKRARLALDEYVSVTPRNEKYTTSLVALRLKFEREFLAICPESRIAPPGFE